MCIQLHSTGRANSELQLNKPHITLFFRCLFLSVVPPRRQESTGKESMLRCIKLNCRNLSVVAEHLLLVSNRTESGNPGIDGYFPVDIASGLQLQHER